MNTPTTLIDLVNRIFKPFIDTYLIVIIDDILIYSREVENQSYNILITWG